MPTSQKSVPGDAVARYAVIGNPIAQSRSPDIHAAFGALTGRALVYERLLATPENFAAMVRGFGAEGGRGLNVTTPFKEAAFDLADQLTDRARAAGAVNTLHFTQQGLVGDNTDGAGLVRDLFAHCDFKLSGARVLLIGAGGAARGVLQPLLAAGVDGVVIANRTLARASELVARARRWPGLEDRTVIGVTLDSLGHEVTRRLPTLIIHATSAGLQAQAPAIPSALFASADLAYDMGYAAQPTPFMTIARAAGCARVLDGLGMLVEQAAESFERWHGVRPETDSVLANLRGPDNDHAAR